MSDVPMSCFYCKHAVICKWREKMQGFATAMEKRELILDCEAFFAVLGEQCAKYVQRALPMFDGLDSVENGDQTDTEQKPEPEPAPAE